MASRTDATAATGQEDTPRRSATVVVTRPRARAAGMVARLEGRGLRVLHLPTIEIVSPADPSPLRAALRDLAAWDWVVFTSTSAVRAVARELRVGTEGMIGAPRVAVVGRATEAAVAEHLGWPVALVPERFTAEGLLEAFGAIDLEGARVLLPLADLARDVLPEGLARRDARVERVVAYRTVPPAEAAVAPVREAVQRGAVDLLTFTSPSTAENFLELLGEAALAVPVAAIGPVTGKAAEALGYRVVAVASEHTADGLVGAAIDYLERLDHPDRESRT